MCEPALVSADPIVTSLGNEQQVFNFTLTVLIKLLVSGSSCFLTSSVVFQAYVYTSETGGCAAFLSNYDTESAAKVLFNNMHYSLPPWSISILPDCRNVVFNTAKV